MLGVGYFGYMILGRSLQARSALDINANLPEECDDEIDDCLVHILFRAKHNPIAQNTRALKKITDLTKFEHWAIGFQFKKDKMVLVEMTNQNMKIVPIYLPETSFSYLKCQFDRVKELDHVQTSPKKIHHIVQIIRRTELPTNGLQITANYMLFMS